MTSPRFLFFYIVLSLAVPNVALCFTEHMPVLACVANVVLPVSLYALLMTLSKKTGRQVWFLFLIVFFAAFQIVLLYLFGRGVIAVDMFLNLVTTNPGEAMELLNNLVPAVATVFVLYLPLLVLAAMSWARHRTEDVAFLKRVRRYSWCGMAAGAVLIALCYAAYPKDSDFDYRAEDNVYPANIFYNLYLACRESGRVADYRKNVASFRFNARSAHDADSAEVYVLVIGETRAPTTSSSTATGARPIRCSQRPTDSACSAMCSRSRTPRTRVCRCCSQRLLPRTTRVCTAKKPHHGVPRGRLPHLVHLQPAAQPLVHRLLRRRGRRFRVHPLGC